MTGNIRCPVEGGVGSFRTTEGLDKVVEVGWLLNTRGLGSLRCNKGVDGRTRVLDKGGVEVVWSLHTLFGSVSLVLFFSCVTSTPPWQRETFICPCSAISCFVGESEEWLK